MKIEYLHETKYGNGTMVAAPVRAADGWQPAKTPARRNGRADTNRATRGLRCARAIRIVIIGSRDPSARDARRQIGRASCRERVFGRV